jgi:hypothetical protein
MGKYVYKADDGAWYSLDPNNQSIFKMDTQN